MAAHAGKSMEGGQADFDRLDAGGRATAAVTLRPRLLVYGALGAAVALSWSLLAAMAVRAAQTSGPGGAGPGSGLLAGLPPLDLPAFAERFVSLCLTPAPEGLAGFGALASMWFLMSLAMMLPSAAPLVRTYCEIADTAARKGERAVHPLVLVSGYLAVWLAASLAFAAAGVLLSRAGLAAAPHMPVAGIAAAAALGLAGLYQFSGLKEACLEKCRNPFATLFARWSTRPVRIFRLGLAEGLWCLGCCWALMLVMFAVGLMNLFWMALLAVLAIVEKQVRSPLPGRIAGALFLVWAVGLLLVSA